MRREIFLRIVDLCKTVRERSVDPFEVDVVNLFERLKDLLSELDERDDLYQDLEAVLGLSDVVLRQGEWVRLRSSLLYFDPLLTLLKIEALHPEELAETLARAWHPIVDLQQLMPGRLREAIEYWWSLPSLEDRRVYEEVSRTETGVLDTEELASLGFISDEEFKSTLEDLWEELRKRCLEGGSLSYWDFVDSDSFGETVGRAYMVSLLCSYDYAEIEVNPLEEEVTLKPLEESMKGKRTGEPRSVPIPINYRDWLMRREESRRKKI